MHKHFPAVPEQKFAGFSMNSGRKGDEILVCFKRMMTSDDPSFYFYVREFSRSFLNVSIKNGSPDFPFESQISQFLILIHDDGSYDSYVNESVVIKMKIRIKEKIEVGALVSKDAIADIQSVEFVGIQIKKSDRIICCLKTGWKFGLYFDVDWKKEIDWEQVPRDLASLERALQFDSLFDSLGATSFGKIKEAGWFPFVEILDKDWQELIRIFENEEGRKADLTKEQYENFLDKFDEERIQKLFKRWLTNPIFKSKEKFLQAGISTFLQNTEEGFISCINNLTPQVEGILRRAIAQETAVKPGYNKLLDFIRIKAEQKNENSVNSLLLGKFFFFYLDEVFLKDFDTQGDYTPSRHVISHGWAEDASLFDRAKALQTILILDQIFFYL